MRFARLALAAAALSVSNLGAPVIMPRETPRVARPVADRRDKKKRQRIAVMGAHQIGRNRKLARRLRRKFELGRSGAF